MQKIRLENVIILMHCDLRILDTTAVIICFNYDASVKFEVTQPICCLFIAFLLLTRYVRL